MPAPDGPLFPHLADPGPALLRLAALQTRYDFEAHRLAPEIETVRDAIYVLEMVEAGLDAAGVKLPDPASVLDIGAKNWHYVRALHALLVGQGGIRRSLALTGIEIDPFVVYRDGHSRFDWARLYSKPLARSTFVAGDAFDHLGAYDLVLVLFPIMGVDEHLDWGLPLSRFRPRDLLAHSMTLVKPGGTLLVTCYEYEIDAVREAWSDLGVVPDAAFPFDSDFADYDTGRFVSVIISGDRDPGTGVTNAGSSL